MANGTQVRRVLLQFETDDGGTEEKLDRINARADELAAKHPELKVKIDSAAAQATMSVLRAELKDAGKDIAPKVDPKIDDAALAATRADLDALGKKIEPEVKPEVKDDPAKLRIDELKKRIELLRLDAKGIKLDFNATPAQIEIAKLELELKGLSETAKNAGTNSGSSFGGGFGAMGYLITAGVVLALAALPAIAAGAGALAGIALGGALLVGTSSVKGPLYNQFHGMLNGLVSVLRVAALPLVKPLGEAFAQIGKWAKALYPELHAVFASLGPLVMPLTKGLEGLVSGILPGFLTLMKAAQPAVAAVAGVLSGLSSSLGGMLGQMAPGIRASSQVITGLGGIIRSLLPVIGQLANLFAGLLGPVIRTIGGTVFPILSRALVSVGRALAPLMPAIGGVVSRLLTMTAQGIAPLLPPLSRLVGVIANGLAPLLPPLAKAMSQVGAQVSGALTKQVVEFMPPLTKMVGVLLKLLDAVVIPLLPPLSKLAGAFLLVQSGGVSPLNGPLVALMTNMANLAGTVANVLIPPLQQLVSWLNTVMSAAESALGFLSKIPGLGFLGGVLGGGGGGLSGAPLSLGAAANPFGGGSGAAYDAAAAAAGAAYGDNWANGVTGAVKSTKTHAAAKPAAANLALILSQGVLAGLEGTAAQVRAAISKLLGAVSTDVRGKYLTTGQGTAISKWLEADESKLTALADKRAKILATIAAADAYAKNVTSNAETTFGVVNAAGSITPALGVGGIMRQLLGDVAQIRVFRANIAKLRKMGLNKAYIDQLFQAGPVQGGEVAAELAAGNEGDIRAVNKAESQIAQASVGLGQTAANLMFDSGKQAGKGFLSGLQAQQKQLEAAMKKLAEVLVQTIKKELKIHSPSQVAYDLFAQVPAGGVKAIDDGHTAMTAASARMARAAVSGRASAGGAAGGGGGWLQVEWVGGSGADQEFISWLKRHIRLRGGDPAVLGA